MRGDGLRRRLPHEIWGSLANGIARLWKPLGIQIRRQARTLQLQETLALGEKRFLAIVRCGDERFLVGSAQGSVSLLATLPKSELSFESAMCRSQGVGVAK